MKVIDMTEEQLRKIVWEESHSLKPPVGVVPGLVNTPIGPHDYSKPSESAGVVVPLPAPQSGPDKLPNGERAWMSVMDLCMQPSRQEFYVAASQRQQFEDLVKAAQNGGKLPGGESLWEVRFYHL